MYHINFRDTYLEDCKRFNNTQFEKIYTKLSIILGMIEKGQFNKLSQYPYKTHKLKGTYKKGKFRLKNCWDLHVKHDIILIYIIDEENTTVDLIRIGTHSELFS